MVPSLILFAFSTPAACQEPATVVSGTVWVVEDGARRMPRWGSLRLCYDVPYGNGRDSVQVELVAGSFGCELPDYAEHVRVGRILLEDRDAACLESELGNLSHALELQARFLPESRLRVRLHDTEQELDTCWLDGSGRGTSLPHVVPPWPQDCPNSGWCGDCPNSGWCGDCPYSGWCWTRELSVRAPGYAWAKVSVDLLAGGDFWLELVPEARLEITVRMPESMRIETLSVREQHGGWASAVQVLESDGQRILFDGLPAGRYEIATGVDTHVPVEHGTVELASGETRRVTVVLRVDKR